jgi:hypothetical protein
LLVSHQLDDRSSFRFSVDFFATAATMAAFYTTYVFQLHQKGLVVALPIFTLIGAYLVYFWRSSHHIEKVSGALSLRGLASLVGLVVLVFFAFIAPPSFVDLEWVNHLLSLCLWGVVLFFAWSFTGAKRRFLGRLILILVFTLLQFIGLSFVTVISYGVLIASFYFLVLRENKTLNQEKRFWLGSFMVIFGALVLIPTLPVMVAGLSDKQTEGLDAVQNAQHKMTTYSMDAIKGSARTSMWKSAVPWIKDHWFIGSGLDTIKYMYPDYRRPEYGILEGGHNFTPDRLHNEYLNNLATRGILPSLVYYVCIILGWYIIVVRGYFRFGNNPYRYLLAGCVAGATVYLGQVMFNFGVVATMVLFYLLVGLGWALVLHPDFTEKQ